MNARVIVLQTFPNSFPDKCRTYSKKDNDDAQKPRKHPFEFFHSVEKQKKELLEFSLSLRKVERDPVLSKEFFSFNKSLVTFIWLLSNFVHGPFEKQMHA